MKYRVGQTVRVKENCDNNFFDVGEIFVITEVDDYGDEDEWNYRNDAYWIYGREIELVKEDSIIEKYTAEYAEKIASENLPLSHLGLIKGGQTYIDGYMKAIEENKVNELMEFINGFINDFEGDYVMDNGDIVDNPCELLKNKYLVAKKLISDLNK
jgi:hypothetical protein